MCGGVAFCFISVMGNSIFEQNGKLLRKSWTNFCLFFTCFFQFFVSDLNRLSFPRTSPVCLNLSPLHICLPSWPVSHWKGAVDKAPLCIFQFLFMFSSDFKAHTHIYTYSCIFGFVVRCREVWLLYLLIGLHDFAIGVIHFIIFNAFYVVLFFDVNLLYYTIF